MPNPPRGARVYLYSCLAGRLFPRWIRNCEVFGHFDEVPTPAGEIEEVVLSFLGRVDALVAGASFDRVEWRNQLLRYVEKAYVKEAERPSGILKLPALYILRKSLLGDESN